jgi:Fe-S oxidoreductase
LFEITQHSDDGEQPTGIMQGEVKHGASGILQALYNVVKWDIRDKQTLTELKDIIFSCMTCRNCEVTCERIAAGVKVLDAFHKGRELLVEDGTGPMPKQRRPLESLARYGNPYGMSSRERKEWQQSLGVPIFSKKGEFDALFFIGCTASNDPRVGNIAGAIIKLLKKAQVSFGILEDEICCGCPALRLGDRLLFEDICQNNLNQFSSLEPRQIISLSPHCYDTFVNHYPKEAMQGIEVRHYSQVLADLIQQGRLAFMSENEETVTYQDPCYLGRHNNLYDEPRRILSSMPGIKLKELKRTRQDSLCCGGGGGRMWSDFEAEENRIANIRVKESLEASTDILVTACPFCFINLDDAVKSVNVEDSLKVKDIAEFVTERI